MEGRHLASPSFNGIAFQQQQQSASPGQQHSQPYDNYSSRLLDPLFSPPRALAPLASPYHPPWRHDEHARFMQALEAVGASGSAAWSQIAAFVGSRSVGETRRHGQQYLARLMQQPPRASAFDWVMDGLSDAETPTGEYPSQNDPGNAPPGYSAAATKPRRAPSDGQRRSGGRRAKVWTFQEDKAFETALASWTSGRPYSWAKIAAALPGKSAKDVRSRYEKLLGDVSSIEGCAFSALSLGGDASRQRPPPIDIAPKDASGRLGLLSPTLFDLLDAPDGKREPADGAKMPTPRVWSEFLADAFKFDETRAPEALESSVGAADVDMGSD